MTRIAAPPSYHVTNLWRWPRAQNSGGSSMLVLSGASSASSYSMWLVPARWRTAARWADVLEANLFPDGRILYKDNSDIYTAGTQSKIVCYNFKTKKWSDLVSSPDKFVNWAMAQDMKYFIYSTGGNTPPHSACVCRTESWKPSGSVKDVHNVDEVASGPSLSASADDSIMVTRDIGTLRFMPLP